MTNNYKDFDVFLFDFDGLLVNTEDLHYNSYLEMVNREGFSLNWDFTTYLTYALESTEALKTAVYNAVPNLYEHQSDWFKLREKKQTIYSNKVAGGEFGFMEGALEFLQALTNSKKTTCVVTNSPRDHIELIKKQLPALNLIKHWITREDYEKPKPAPDAYLKALELLKPKRAIAFEDAKKGLVSLKNAEIKAVLVAPKYYPKFDPDLLKDVWRYSSMHDVLKDFTTS